MRIRDWMTANPQTIHQDDRLAEARERMDRGGFRRLPVVDREGHLIGILTDRDIREHHGHLHDTRVTGAMVENPITVGPDDPVEAAVDLVLGRRIGGLPVVTPEGELVGIITQTDLLRGLVGRRPGDEEPASHVDVELVTPGQSLAGAIALIEAEGTTIVGIRGGWGCEGTRVFRLRLGTRDPARFAAMLREHDFEVRLVHPPAD